MYRQFLRDSKPSAQLLFAAFVILASGIVVTLTGIVLGWLIFGVHPAQLERVMTDLSNPDNIAVIKFYQTIQSIGVFVIPPFVIAWFLHDNPVEFLGFDNKPLLKSVLLVVGIVYFSNPVINWLTEINAKLSLPQWMNPVELWMQNAEKQASQITGAFLSTSSVKVLLLNIIIIGVLPALGEELLFRGIIQQLFKKKFRNAHMSIWISAAIFSAVHMQFFGFLPRLLLGAMFGYMLEWSGSLWLPVIAHFVNNTTAVVAYFLMQKGVIGGGLEKTGTSSDGSFYMVIVSFIFLFIFFRELYLNKIPSRMATNH